MKLKKTHSALQLKRSNSGNTVKGVGGVDDGARTHDHRNHNPGLYQLSYAHHRLHQHQTIKTTGTPDRNRTCNPQLRRLVLYPVELRAQLRRLSRHTGRGGEIRTPDILLPKQARYQATLHPDWRAETISPHAPNVNLTTVILHLKLH